MAKGQTFTAMLAFGLLWPAPMAAQSCYTDASGTRVTCGMLSGNKVGNMTFWSDGTTTSHVGNFSSHSDGSSDPLKSNAPLMGSGSFNQDGDRTSNGTRSCSLIGSTSFCN